MALRDLLRRDESAIALADPEPSSGDAPAELSTKDAAALVLREAGGPMHVKAIAAAVLERGLAPGLRGKTPEATIGAQIATDARRPDGRFVKVDRGTYDLRERMS